MNRLLTVLVACSITSCGGDPTVSMGGSDEDRRASIDRVKDSLPEDRRDDFEEAMKALLFSDVQGLGDLADTEGMIRRMEDRIEGKTGEEIIAAGETAREERKRREREEAASEVKELVAKLDPAHEERLASFIVERSFFRRSGGGFFGSDAGINLVVRNETGHAVSRAYFQAMLLTPGRALPWVDAEFNYEIPGGIEHGESAEWNLSPNMYGEWSKAPKDREDTVLIVRTIGLDGADGTSLTGERLSSYDQERLVSLMESVDFEGKAEIQSTLDARSGMLDQWRDTAARRNALAELTLLRERKLESDAAAEKLAAFEVTRSRFYWRDGNFGRKEAVMELNLRNGTGVAVTQFKLQGVLSSPGREVPWVDAPISYTIPGGIEPGGSKELKLAPNMFGSWTNAPRDRTDMVLTTTVLSLEGADGEDLFAAEWEPEDESRLAAIEQMVAEQSWK